MTEEDINPTKTPKVSFCIRTLNEARWLPTVLKKLNEQTTQDFEIIIIDSGSTDKTLEIASNNPKTKRTHQKVLPLSVM